MKTKATLRTYLLTKQLECLESIKTLQAHLLEYGITDSDRVLTSQSLDVWSAELGVVQTVLEICQNRCKY